MVSLWCYYAEHDDQHHFLFSFFLFSISMKSLIPPLFSDEYYFSIKLVFISCLRMVTGVEREVGTCFLSGDATDCVMSGAEIPEWWPEWSRIPRTQGNTISERMFKQNMSRKPLILTPCEKKMLPCDIDLGHRLVKQTWKVWGWIFKACLLIPYGKMYSFNSHFQLQR